MPSDEPGPRSRTWPLAWVAAGVLAPWLMAQGRRVRRTTPGLPEPLGDRHGQWQVPWPCDPQSQPGFIATTSRSMAPSQGPGASRLGLLLLGDSSMAGVGAAHQTDALSGALTHELQRTALAGYSQTTPPARNLRDDQSTSQCQPPQVDLQVDWQIAARTGLRTRDMVGALPGLLQASGCGAVATPRAAASFASTADTRDPGHRDRFDLALVALGVNDATALQSTRAFRQDVRVLCERLHERHGIRRILWSGLPPVHRFPALPQPLRHVLGRKAIELDAVLREQGADYVPMPSRLDDAWIASDGFHPGPQAYRAWAIQLAPYLRTALNGLACQRL